MCVDLSAGVPSGRAWGIESDLRPLPSEGALVVRLSVGGDDVREAFARVAYYAQASTMFEGSLPAPKGCRRSTNSIGRPPRKR